MRSRSKDYCCSRIIGIIGNLSTSSIRDKIRINQQIFIREDLENVRNIRSDFIPGKSIVIDIKGIIDVGGSSIIYGCSIGDSIKDIITEIIIPHSCWGDV